MIELGVAERPGRMAADSAPTSRGDALQVFREATRAFQAHACSCAGCLGGGLGMGHPSTGCREGNMLIGEVHGLRRSRSRRDRCHAPRRSAGARREPRRQPPASKRAVLPPSPDSLGAPEQRQRAEVGPLRSIEIGSRRANYGNRRLPNRPGQPRPTRKPVEKSEAGRSPKGQLAQMRMPSCEFPA